MNWIDYGSGAGSRSSCDLKSLYCEVAQSHTDIYGLVWSWYVNITACYSIRGTSRSLEDGKQACEKHIKAMITSFQKILK